MRIGVQTYTIRKAARRDLPGALARLKTLGVGCVELARVPLSPRTARSVRASGLSVSSVQARFKDLSAGFDAAVAFCKAVECPLVVVSVLPLSCIVGGERQLCAFARRLDGLAARYREAGMALAFHHHDFEFKRLGGRGPYRGRLKLELLVERTAPIVKFVVDTYWARRAGDDPCRLIAWLGERLAGLHLRDHVAEGEGARAVIRDAELGRGDIDFAAVLRAASPYASYAAIEQKSEAPFESLALSLEHVRRLGLVAARPDAGPDAGPATGQDTGKEGPCQ